MPFRQLPNSDPTRTRALDALFNKAAGTLDADLPFPVALRTQINAFRPTWLTETGQVDTALTHQVDRSDEAAPLASALDQAISHFIQVFNFGVQRGVFERSDRVYYGLEAAQSDVPPIVSHADRVFWAEKIAAGEAQRHADKPAQPSMALPSAAEIAAALAAYLAAHALQSTAKEAYDEEQADVAGLRAGADALILEVWDQIEFTYRRLDGPGRRRKGREWGIVYVPRPGETPDPGNGGGGGGGTPPPLPGPPQNVVVTTGDLNSGEVSFSWDERPPEEGVTGYKVYRDGAPLAVPAGPPVTFGGFTTGDTINLTVSAVNAAGEGPQSVVASGAAG